MGDNALQISAKLLKSCIRSNDFIPRYGGEEFQKKIDKLMYESKRLIKKLTVFYSFHSNQMLL